jgi:uncharacterized protein (TIGR01777 family)
VKVVLSGGSGLIGTALIPELRAAGHEVVRLVRREPQTSDEIRWDPLRGQLDPTQLAGVEAAIHLSGAGVGSRRWSDSYRRTLLASRIESTTLLSDTLAKISPLPKVLIAGSAVGFYGDTRDQLTDETGPRGEGFLAELTGAWEASSDAASSAGIRVCYLRTGIVLSKAGGALKLQLPLFKTGLGGRLGSGKQYLSWVTIDDEVAAILFLLTAEQVSGAVNVVAPNPVTNLEFTKTLGSVLRRPTITPAPAFALRILLDGFADEGLLIGQRLAPRVLQDAGFTFRHPELTGALKAVLAK